MEFLKWIVTSVMVTVSSVFGVQKVEVPTPTHEPIVDGFAAVRSLSDLEKVPEITPVEEKKEAISSAQATSTISKASNMPASSTQKRDTPISIPPPTVQTKSVSKYEVIIAKIEQLSKVLEGYEPELADAFTKIILQIRSSPRTDIPELRLFVQKYGSSVEELSRLWEELALIGEKAILMTEQELDVTLKNAERLIKIKEGLLVAYNKLPLMELVALEGKTAMTFVPKGVVSERHYSFPANQAQAFTLTVLTAQGTNTDYVVTWDDGTSDRGVAASGKPVTLQHIFSPGMHLVTTEVESVQERIAIAANPVGNGGDKMEILSPKPGWKFGVVTKMPVTVSVKAAKIFGSAHVYLQNKKDAPLAAGYVLGEMSLLSSNPTKSFDLKNIPPGTYWIQVISDGYTDCTGGPCVYVLPMHRIGPVEITDISSYHETGILPTDIEGGAQGAFISP